MSKSKAHHLSNGRFRNNQDLELKHTSVWNILKWKLFESLPEPIEIPNRQVDFELFEQADASKIIWVGHSTFLIRHQGLNILTDPHFSKRASPLQWIGPKRYTAPAMSIEELPHIDLIVISHDHYDHLDKQSVIAINKKQQDNPPLFAVPLGLGKWLDKRGVKNWVELDWWEANEFKGWRVSAVPVQHFSGRGLKPNNTLWCGWVLETPDAKKIFFAGDTGYSPDFKDIGNQFGSMDLSLIPIGAYEPRWFMDEIHVNPDEAVMIHQDVNSRYSIGMHWGTFMLTNEEMLEPPQQLEQARSKYDIAEEDFIVVEQGETKELFK